MTTQLAFPYTDISNSGWTRVPPQLFMYACLADDRPDDDLSYVQSSDNPSGDTFEVKFYRLAVPQIGPAGQLLVRLRSTDSGNNTPVSLWLLQGTQVLLHQTVWPDKSYETVVLNLSPILLAQITDFTDLRLRVTAGGPKVSCCPNALPVTLFGTFSGGTETCVCLNGITVELTCDPESSPPTWNGNFNDCIFVNTLFSIWCDPLTGWNLNDPCVGGTDRNPTASCNPFQVQWVGLPGLGCCTGSVTVTVTT